MSNVFRNAAFWRLLLVSGSTFGLALCIIDPPSRFHIAPGPFPWDVALAYAGLAWMLLFAGVLAVRRPGDRRARILAGLLIGIALNSLLLPANFVTPWPWLNAFMSATCFAMLVTIALLATYALDFARPPSRLRNVLAYCAYAVACICALIGIAGLAPPGSSTIGSLPFLLPLICGIIAAAQTRGAERSRFLWAFIPLAPLYACEFLDNPAIPFPHGLGRVIHGTGNVFAFIAPLGLTYSLLSRDRKSVV